MKIFVNALTLTRIVATFILPFIWKNLNPLAIIIIVSCVLLTDAADGFLARRFHVQSLFGSIADTVADKIFGVVLLLIVAIYFPIFYIIAVLELLIVLVNLTAAIRGATTKSSFLGRTKMWVLGFATVIGIINVFYKELISIDFISKFVKFIVNNDLDLLNSSVLITVGCQIMVVTDYIRHIVKELRTEKPKVVYKFKGKEELKKVLFDTEYFLSHKDTPVSKHLLK